MTPDEVVDDRTGLMDHAALIGDDRRFAEGMDRLQLGRRQPGLRIALIALDPIGEAQLLEEPQDALRSGVVEVVNDNHGHLPPFGAASGAPSDILRAQRAIASLQSRWIPNWVAK